MDGAAEALEEARDHRAAGPTAGVEGHGEAAAADPLDVEERERQDGIEVSIDGVGVGAGGAEPLQRRVRDSLRH